MKTLLYKLELKNKLSPSLIGFFISLILHLCFIFFFILNKNHIINLDSYNIKSISLNIANNYNSNKKVNMHNKNIKKYKKIKNKKNNNLPIERELLQENTLSNVTEEIHTKELEVSEDNDKILDTNYDISNNNIQSIDNNNSLYQNIRDIINRNRPYPRMARVKNIQGNVIVEFVLFKNGNIDNIRIIKGTHKILDNNAIKTIKEASREFPKPPNNVKLKIEIQYKLT